MFTCASCSDGCLEATCQRSKQEASLHNVAHDVGATAEVFQTISINFANIFLWIFWVAALNFHLGTKTHRNARSTNDTFCALSDGPDWRAPSGNLIPSPAAPELISLEEWDENAVVVLCSWQSHFVSARCMPSL